MTKRAISKKKISFSSWILFFLVVFIIFGLFSIIGLKSFDYFSTQTKANQCAAIGQDILNKSIKCCPGSVSKVEYLDIHYDAYGKLTGTLGYICEADSSTEVCGKGDKRSYKNIYIQTCNWGSWYTEQTCQYGISGYGNNLACKSANNSSGKNNSINGSGSTSTNSVNSCIKLAKSCISNRNGCCSGTSCKNTGDGYFCESISYPTKTPSIKPKNTIFSFPN